MQLRTVSSSRFHFRPAILSRLRYSFTSADIENRPAELVATLTPREHDFRDMSFTFAAIALCAKVAFADGKLSREKYIAFRAAFPLTGGLCVKLRKLFLLACKNPTPFEHYTTQIKHMFPGRKDVFTSLMDRLFSIATAEGKISSEADLLLARIARALGINGQDYTGIRTRNMAPHAHDILGIDRKTPRKDIKKHYHALMRRFHPDRFAAQDLSPELSLLLQLKSSEISQAYAMLAKKAA